MTTLSTLLPGDPQSIHQDQENHQTHKTSSLSCAQLLVTRYSRLQWQMAFPWHWGNHKHTPLPSTLKAQSKKPNNPYLPAKINGIPQSQYNLHQTQEGIDDFISHIYSVALSSPVVAHFSVNYAHWLYSNAGSSQKDSITKPITENNLHLAVEGTNSVTELNTVKQENSYLFFFKCLPCKIVK